jgi:integrase
MLKNMGNHELFQLYDKELILRLCDANNLTDTRKILARFSELLGSNQASIELAKFYLYQFTAKKPRTLYRYTRMVRMFMKWYGEPIEDFKVRIPKSISPYTDDADIDKLLDAIENKATHKKIVTRYRLLVELALKSGLRRDELSNLEIRDSHNVLLVKDNGKSKFSLQGGAIFDSERSFRTIVRKLHEMTELKAKKLTCIGSFKVL